MIFPSSNSRSDFYDKSVTAVSVKAPFWRLSGRGMFFIGSCFADYLYREYQSAGLNAAVSPFGNIYNPESLAEAAQLLSGRGGKITAEDCFNTKSDSTEDSGFRHFMFHSQITAPEAGELADRLNGEIAAARSFLSRAEAVVITLGTSLVYRLKSERTVNNCHKLPGTDFDRVQLGPEQAAAALSRAIENFRLINPELKVIITLSPVRHLRDDAAENSLSKAVLRCAIDDCCIETNNWYFPSYEIMLDELRDYRWYADDLCHPSAKAVSYIISRFIMAAYEDSFKDFIKDYSRLLRDLNHRPFNPDSDEYRQFKAGAEKKKEELAAAHPNLFLR